MLHYARHRDSVSSHSRGIFHARGSQAVGDFHVHRRNNTRQWPSFRGQHGVENAQVTDDADHFRVWTTYAADLVLGCYSHMVELRTDGLQEYRE